MNENIKIEFNKTITENNISEKAAVIQKIVLPSNANINVFIKREDLIHPFISGNKWRKLKYNLLEAKILKAKRLLTFGGAFSNHIYATASAGKIFAFETIGIIRGEEHLPLNPTLSFAKECGMELHYMSRSLYRNKNSPNTIKMLKDKFGDFYLIPEGGTNLLALNGCEEIINEVNIDYDYICSACGTGGTLSGIISSLKGEKNIVGIPVLKGAQFLIHGITKLVENKTNNQYQNWSLNLDYHFGGYAKITKELIEFMNWFEKNNNIELDPIYTGKLLFAVNDMIKKNYFKACSNIIVIHTGGLQGTKGMQNKIDKLLS